MKKLIFILAIIFFLPSETKAQAIDASSFVPATFNGITYDSVYVYVQDYYGTDIIHRLYIKNPTIAEDSRQLYDNGMILIDTEAYTDGDDPAYYGTNTNPSEITIDFRSGITQKNYNQEQLSSRYAFFSPSISQINTINSSNWNYPLTLNDASYSWTGAGMRLYPWPWDVVQEPTYTSPENSTDGFLEFPNILTEPVEFFSVLFQNTLIFIKNLIFPSTGFFSTKLEEIKTTFNESQPSIALISQAMTDGIASVNNGTPQPITVTGLKVAGTTTGEIMVFDPTEYPSTTFDTLKLLVSGIMYFSTGMWLLHRFSTIFNS